MSCESHKYYNGNLYVSIAKYVKNQQLSMNLYAYTNMDVQKSIIKPKCGYCNGCKNQQLFTKPICKYCNGCKKSAIIYETYMQVL